MIIDTGKASKRAIKILVISNDSLILFRALSLIEQVPKMQKLSSFKIYLSVIESCFRFLSLLPNHGAVVGVVREPELLRLVAAVVLLRAPEPPDCGEGECLLLPLTSPRVQTSEDRGAKNLIQALLDSLL